MLFGDLPEVSTKDGQTIHGFPIRILNPPKTALLRFPTDAEILRRFSKQLTVSQNEGRGKSSTRDIPSPAADLELLQAIRLDKDGPDFNEYEAAKAIAKISYCRVVSCDLKGSVFEVVLDTYAGPTMHLLSTPTEEQMWHYQEGIVSSRSMGHGKTELKYRHQVAVDLYDELTESEGSRNPPGYSCPIPANHKFVVILAMAEAYDQLDEPLSPNS